MITDTREIPESAREQMKFWLAQFRADWRGEVPIKLHEGHGGLGAAPAFTHAFNDYIGRLTCQSPHCHECRCKNATCDRCYDRRKREQTPNTLHRSRTTRAFRKLRKVAPREFDVLYLICQQGLSLAETRNRLNERSIQKGKVGEEIDIAGVFVLAMVGTEKLKTYF
jgi:hypothetical protein